MADEDDLEDLLEELDSQRDLETAEQVLSLRIEKRRYDKPVTIVEGLDLPPSDLKSTASALKRALGTGGTISEGRIELQGDHRDRVAERLRDQGYTVHE